MWNPTTTASLVLLCMIAGENTVVAFAPSSKIFNKPSLILPIKTSSYSAINVKPPRLTNNDILTPSRYVDDETLGTFDFPRYENDIKSKPVTATSSIATITTLLTLTTTPLPAEATSSSSQIPSALAAYGHYASILIIFGAIIIERLTVEANMSKEKEQLLAITDSVLGVTGLALVYTGYLRATQYGKGWDFYSHEPLFWAKMVALAVFGACSFFPTAIIIKRSIAIQRGEDLMPMTEKMASRMRTVLNAEILAMLTIPLLATLMSRGILYNDGIPFQYIGPVLTVGVLGGLGYKYINEALTWKEDEVLSGGTPSVKEDVTV